MTDLLDRISSGVGKFCDKAYNHGWMTYAIIGIILAIIIILWKS